MAHFKADLMYVRADAISEWLNEPFPFRHNFLFKIQGKIELFSNDYNIKSNLVLAAALSEEDRLGRIATRKLKIATDYGYKNQSVQSNPPGALFKILQ